MTFSELVFHKLLFEERIPVKNVHSGNDYGGGIEVGIELFNLQGQSNRVGRFTIQQSASGWKAFVAELRKTL